MEKGWVFKTVLITGIEQEDGSGKGNPNPEYRKYLMVWEETRGLQF
jgi:hypothetical protein